MNSFEVNKVQIDEFGRKSGVLLIDKPVGITSHDVVYKVRNAYSIKKVGHAGALDPFASGLLIILIGKATKLSDKFLGLDKSYEMRVLFGVSTDSADTEGKVQKCKKPQVEIKRKDVLTALSSFEPEYLQYVPVFSSVKVNGEKLRKLARKFYSFRVVSPDKSQQSKYVEFVNEANEVVHTTKLPCKSVKIWDSKIIGSGNILKSEMGEFGQNLKDSEYQYFDISLSCSKGTYIRQLAVDLGEKLDSAAMLVELRRTRIGEHDIANTLNLNSL